MDMASFCDVFKGQLHLPVTHCAPSPAHTSYPGQQACSTQGMYDRPAARCPSAHSLPLAQVPDAAVHFAYAQAFASSCSATDVCIDVHMQQTHVHIHDLPLRISKVHTDTHTHTHIPYMQVHISPDPTDRGPCSERALPLFLALSRLSCLPVPCSLHSATPSMFCPGCHHLPLPLPEPQLH